MGLWKFWLNPDCYLAAGLNKYVMFRWGKLLCRSRGPISIKRKVVYHWMQVSLPRHQREFLIIMGIINKSSTFCPDLSQPNGSFCAAIDKDFQQLDNLENHILICYCWNGHP